MAQTLGLANGAGRALLGKPDTGSTLNGGGSGGWQPLNEASGGLLMKVIVDLCVVPIGVGVILAPYIATC